MWQHVLITFCGEEHVIQCRVTDNQPSLMLNSAIPLIIARFSDFPFPQAIRSNTSREPG
jgi:hypothetical protein